MAAPYEDPDWREQHRLRIDYSYVMEDTIGTPAGVSRRELADAATRMAAVDARARAEHEAGALGFMDLPKTMLADLPRLVETADRLAAAGDSHVVLGIGGSYLGARALFEALAHPYHNELPPTEREGHPRLYFAGNGLDTDALQGLLDRLPAVPSTGALGRMTLNVISKSGETLETALAFRLLRQRVERVWGADAKQAIVATTDAARGRLRDLAAAAGYETFEIPDNVGGRYSVLTAVGLLPAAIVGIDVAELLAGARYMAGLCEASDPYLNPAYLLAVLHTLMYQEKGRTISVFSAWSPGLEAIGLWYDQLLAESLGKDGIGPTPLTVVNSRELHSRGQQHQEGAHDKLISNVVVAIPGREQVVLPDVPGDADGLNYLAGRTLHDGQQAAIEATAFAYRRAGRPTLDIALPEVRPFTVGQLVYLLELTTVVEGWLLGINPLDQPGVEAYKNFMFGLLERPDAPQFARYRAALTAAGPRLGEFRW
ncbi:MAG: glucose-6-phosphate isomerase [Dehalococcoidia bacterium]|nr:glucose-6-phosphate isomerase [Dehalococcoidia bacterium]